LQIVPRAPRDARARQSYRRPSGAVVGVAAAMLLLVALAGPALAQDGPTKLFDPAVSPRTVTLGATITFSVSYRNREGSDPAYVRVSVAGRPRLLVRSGTGGTIHDGIRYAGSFVLPVGSWPVTFQASDTRRFATSLAAGTVTVAAPLASPTPAPTTRPTPRPTPRPTASPTDRPGPTASPEPTDASLPPGVSASPSGPGATSSVPPPGLGGGPIGAPSSDPGGPLPSLAPSPTPEAAAGGATGADSAGGPSAGGSGGPGSRGDWRDLAVWSPSLAAAWLPPILGGTDLTPLQRVMISTLTTTTGAVVVMSFALFGKRRRDEEPTAPDEVLEAHAASGGLPAAGRLVPQPVLEGELAMPRWRRPSLLEARKADPARTAPPKYSLTFRDGSATPGLERRRIRYRVVRLLDGPDELLASEIGFLDEGDEVQLVERSGSFWNVLCPDGRSGWVHRMVLGDIIAATEEPDPDVDADVLAAFLAARAQAS